MLRYLGFSGGNNDDILSFGMSDLRLAHGHAPFASYAPNGCAFDNKK